METSYSFRHWTRDIALWCLSTDEEEAKQAPAIVLQRRGAARDMAQYIEINQVTHGGRLLENSVERELGLVPYLMAVLTRRFEPLAEEIALRSTFDFLNSQRRIGEKT
eukprot:3278795-Lingulodinium_polyedra.AAC.1